MMIISHGSRIQIFDTYVIKEILSSDDDEPLDLAAIREAHVGVVAKTIYPYVPTMYSWEGTTIKMERVHGVRMDDYITLHPDRLPEIIGRVKHIVNILLDGGVYHGDPAPRNLFIDENDNIWLIDFGSGQIIHGSDNHDELYQMSMFMFFDALEIGSPFVDEEIKELTLFAHVL